MRVIKYNHFVYIFKICIVYILSKLKLKCLILRNYKCLKIVYVIFFVYGLIFFICNLIFYN